MDMFFTFDNYSISINDICDYASKYSMQHVAYHIVHVV